MCVFILRISISWIFILIFLLLSLLIHEFLFLLFFFIHLLFLFYQLICYFHAWSQNIGSYKWIPILQLLNSFKHLGFYLFINLLMCKIFVIRISGVSSSIVNKFLKIFILCKKLQQFSILLFAFWNGFFLRQQILQLAIFFWKNLVNLLLA